MADHSEGPGSIKYHLPLSPLCGAGEKQLLHSQCQPCLPAPPLPGEGLQREWVEGSAGSWCPACGTWDPVQGAPEHQPLVFLAPLRFPSNLLFTSASGELWKMVRIGGQPLGFGEPCGLQWRGDLGVGHCKVSPSAGALTPPGVTASLCPGDRWGDGSLGSLRSH